MKKSVSYDEHKLQRLSDLSFARGYLAASLDEYRKDGNREAFLLALRDIVRAQGGIPELSKKLNKPRQSLYKALSKNGNPTLDLLDAILGTLGFQLSVEPIDANL